MAGRQLGFRNAAEHPNAPRKLRRAPEPLAASLQKPVRADRVRQIVKRAADAGVYGSEIAPYLSERQRRLVEKLVGDSSKSLRAIAAEAGMSAASACSQLAWVEKKLKHWEAGEPLKKRGWKAGSIRHIVEGRIAHGEMIEQIIRKAHLSPTEARVLEGYVMADERPLQREVADEIGRSKVTVTMAIATIYNKLLGKKPRAHLGQKYEAMSDRELGDAIKRGGAVSRTGFYHANRDQYLVADKRGALDRIFPLEKSGVLKEIGNEARRQLKERTLEEILAPLGPVEREIITRRALPESPERPRRFKERHGIESPGALRKMEEALLRKLRRLPACSHIQGLAGLRAAMEALGEKGMRLARIELSGQMRMLEILDRRGYAESPVLLTVLAEEWGVSRERARQLEGNLAKKLRQMAH